MLEFDSQGGYRRRRHSGARRPRGGGARLPRLSLRKPSRTMLPLPTLPHMAHSAFGHGRSATDLPPETEVRYC